MSPIKGSTIDLNQLAADIPSLVSFLRHHRYAVGLSETLAAARLLNLFVGQGHETMTTADVAASLGPLFCTSATDQQRFPDLIETWFNQNLKLAAVKSGTAVNAQLTDVSPSLQYPRWKRFWPAIAAAVVVAIAVGVSIWIDDEPEVSQQVEQPGEATETVEPTVPLQPERPLIFAPRVDDRPLMPPPRFEPWWHRWRLNYLLPWLPILLFVPWAVHLYRQRAVVLDRTQRLSRGALDSLDIGEHNDRLFESTTADPFWSRLRSRRPLGTKRLDESATVKKTLAAAGRFTPVFTERMVPTEYVMLIDRHHARDHVAELARCLYREARRKGVFIDRYAFNQDPRYPYADFGRFQSMSVSTIRSRRLHDGLLYAGDADVLLDPQTGALHTFAQQLNHFSPRWLFSPRSAYRWAYTEQALHDDGYAVAPLSRPGLSETGEPSAQAFSDRRELFQRSDRLDKGLDSPPDFADPGWLEDELPAGQTLESMTTALRRYLGKPGYSLLLALAAYPELRWPLTISIDHQLFHGSGEGEATRRERRIRKLSRLVWFRHGHLPLYLRKHLLLSATHEERRTLADCWQSLLHQDSDTMVSLPVAVPNWRSSITDTEDYAERQLAPHLDNDRVFARAVRGRKPRLWEFTVAKRHLSRLPEDWRSLWQKLLPFAALTPIVAALLWWITQPLSDLAERQAITAMKTAYEEYTVIVEYADDALEQVADVLTGALQERGFTAEVERLYRKGSVELEGNGLSWQAGDQTLVAVVDDIRREVEYLTYGAQINDDTKAVGGVVGEVRIDLRVSNQPARVFRDGFQRVSGTQTTTGSAVAPILEPVMVPVPGGSFLMGSKTGALDEQPVHSVQIKAFEMSKTEITFAQYGAFASETDRVLPDDVGLGRGNRPVINVNWDDAVAYATWLTEQTGKQYRLPTEAEWEYAARAGTTTAFWWGDELGIGIANCALCGEQSRGTVPVASYDENSFGLFDTAGNVWEWLQDCWHEDYSNAPEDGRAWLEENNGDCDRRVLRGGGWFGLATNLRSSFRGREHPRLP